MTHLIHRTHRLFVSATAFAMLCFLPGTLFAEDKSFGNPTANSPVSACLYNSTTCAAAGKHHTGIDYHSGGTNEVFASNAGKIVRIEFMSTSDHGMGNNVIIEHQIGTAKIYTSYSHMASINSSLTVGSNVTKGQNLGIIGGSGYGKANYWGRHLHFEIKDKAVTNNPFGGGLYWGYTPTSANGFGYHDPNLFIGKIIVFISSPRVSDSLTETASEDDPQEEQCGLPCNN